MSKCFPSPYHFYSYCHFFESFLIKLSILFGEIILISLYIRPLPPKIYRTFGFLEVKALYIPFATIIAVRYLFSTLSLRRSNTFGANSSYSVFFTISIFSKALFLISVFTVPGQIIDTGMSSNRSSRRKASE